MTAKRLVALVVALGLFKTLIPAPALAAGDSAPRAIGDGGYSVLNSTRHAEFTATAPSITYSHVDVTGTYQVDVTFLGVHYAETLILVQSGTSITGTSLDLNSAPRRDALFTISSGSVAGNVINFDGVNGDLTTHFTGVITDSGSMSGTWADAAPSARTGTWKTTSGYATVSTDAWAATITGRGISGRASLAVPATGWATTAFSLSRMKVGVAVAARIVAGGTCDATAATITTLPGFTTTSGGTWRERWIFDGGALIRLRSAIRSGTTLWFDVSVGGVRVCTTLAPAT